MYVQMLDICIENIGYFRHFRKYHDIFQPCSSHIFCNKVSALGALCEANVTGAEGRINE